MFAYYFILMKTFTWKMQKFNSLRHFQVCVLNYNLGIFEKHYLKYEQQLDKIWEQIYSCKFKFTLISYYFFNKDNNNSIPLYSIVVHVSTTFYLDFLKSYRISLCTPCLRLADPKIFTLGVGDINLLKGCKYRKIIGHGDSLFDRTFLTRS